MRVMAGVGAGVAAMAISGSALWLAFRADLAAWTYGVALDRGRDGLLATLTELVRAALDAPGTGVATLGAAAAVLTVTVVGAVFGFRRLAAVARSQQG
jgi:hypothetical protein